jgi:hypothetical protein
MTFFHSDGYRRAVEALEAERDAEIRQLKAEHDASHDEKEKESIAADIKAMQSRYREQLRKLERCLF